MSFLLLDVDCLFVLMLIIKSPGGIYSLLVKLFWIHLDVFCNHISQNPRAMLLQYFIFDIMPEKKINQICRIFTVIANIVNVWDNQDGEMSISRSVVHRVQIKSYSEPNLKHKLDKFSPTLKVWFGLFWFNVTLDQQYGILQF